jgi:hypothetical protein
MAFALDHTIQSLHAAAALVQQAWIAAAERLAYPVPHRLAYLMGLQTPESLVYPWQGNPLAIAVVNTAAEAVWVEKGTRAIHLPATINWGSARAAKRGKRGVPYMVIPFRHIAPRGRVTSPSSQVRTMPEQLYRRALRTPMHREVSLRGIKGITPYVPRQAINVRPGYTARSKYAGMQRVPGIPGEGRGSRYLTFRTMSADSTGWWLPARPGVPLLQRVQRATSGQVHRLIAAGMQADVEDALRQQVEGRP